ncbi:hypothetical protein RhiirA4_489984, partial [Rhizophagus irregularis]
MTYKSLQEIELAFPEPENESYEARKKRLKNKQQAIRRFKQRQQSSQSTTTTNARIRKQKSRTAMTDEQRTNILEQNKLAHQSRYAAQQEQLRSQFLKIGCYNIDNYNENMIEGDEIENGRHRFERMNKICDKCYALKWKNKTKGFCCLDGQVILSPLHEAPPMLYNLLTSNDPNTDKPYVNNIRAYNSIFAFTSLGANIDEDLANAKEGALYHRIGGLMPKENYPPAFAQIYFYDSNMDNQLKRRQEIFPNLNSDMLSALQTELYDIENPFVHNFITAGEQAKSINNIDDMRLIIHKTHGKDMRQYNKPTASEVA